jgi:hypothetical protein
MDAHMNRHLLLATAALSLGLASAAAAQHPAPAPAPAPAKGETVRMADDAKSWISDPHIKGFYEMTKATFAGGAAKVDAKAFEQRSMAIFREFAKSRGMDPDAMQDHLKLIPGQVIQIVREDPKVLDSYDNFVAAMFGPD